jgi:hypothetical protein
MEGKFMSSDPRVVPVPKAMVWAGWIVGILPSLLLLMSGVMKLLRLDVATKGMRDFGYDESVLLPLGIVEVACTVIYLIPRTAFLGAILLTGYLGGAVATHLRMGEPFFHPIIFGALLWLGLYLRDARLRALVPLRS